jgi:hypothetical protein
MFKLAEDFAPGLPDPKRFGRVEDIPPDELLPYVVQLHKAQRAGTHYDVRMGGGPPGGELYSWATKKELPQPGGRPIMLYQQPLHKGEYASFEGTLHSGYGKGSVKTHDKGSIIVTQATPGKIKFVVTHHKYPENFVMLRQSGPPKDLSTERGRKTQGGSWLLINTTPRDAARLLGGDAESVGLHKLKYTSIPAEKVDKLFDPNYLVQEKVDGASQLFHLLSDKLEAVSYRVSENGRPIIHTYRIFGPSGGKLSVKVPPELVGSIVRGEVYGERGGKAIPTQELGGILNASVQRSLEKQREGKVNLKAMLFDVVRYGKEPATELTSAEREEKLKSILPYLPQGKFHLPETARDPEAAKALWEKITSGQHPRTSEGIIGWPLEAGKKPVKVKTYPESDVWVRNVFPGEGKLKDTAAGGFEYSLSPEGPVVGKVGTGFTEATRREMWEDPESWQGRMARIRSQERFPSGAHRAPSFLSLHEDFPSKTATYLVRDALRSGHARYRAHAR